MNRTVLILLMAFGCFTMPSVGFSVGGIVTTRENRSFEGILSLSSDGRIKVDASAGEGSVSYLFSKESIANIEFLDAEAVEAGMEAFDQRHHKTAINFLESIHRNRSPFLKIFPKASLAEPSLALGKSYLAEELFANVTGVAGVLLGSDFRDATIHEQANELLLLAFFGLQRWDETKVLAERWCKNREPFHDSALGWWILGEVHLAKGNLAEARWVSMQPITFSSQYPKSYLQDCYHVAIASWIQESPERALRLFEEYQSRGYTWPEAKHPETRLKLGILATKDTESSGDHSDEEPLTIQDGEPEKDLSLPLRSVRKLTTNKE